MVRKQCDNYKNYFRKGPGVNQQIYQAPPQMNGNDDSIVGGNVGIQQTRANPQLAHILQNRGNVNPRMAMNNKSPNIQGATIMNSTGGVVNMPMSMASNNVTNNNNNAVNSMQGRKNISLANFKFHHPFLLASTNFLITFP